MTTPTGRPTPEIPTGIGLDTLLRRAAQRHPERPAIRSAEGTLSYRDLDERADHAAAGLATLAGDAGGGTVAVVPLLAAAFPIVYFGALRAGRTVVAATPFLTGEGLARILATADVRVAVLTAALHERLRPYRDTLPDLRAVVLVDGAPARDEPGVRQLADVLAAGAARGHRPVDVDPDATAYIHFTSGTTGPPKGVLMSHRNLVANAVQTAYAHELDVFRTVLNHLPIFHFMHLGAAVHAGVTQVLAPGPDTVAALELADASGAEVCYALPAQLARLAADPRLPEVRLTTTRVVRTGGTALRPAVARRLSRQFGVPVLQGYGMAETSALTHSGSRGRPVAESVGPPVPHTECRIVDLDTGAVLPPGERGEVQVRGPQVSAGYWGGDHPAVLTADGWLRTGDVGHQDAEGLLYLVDRRDDLFKVGNALVAPADVEAVLRTDPAVADCAVVAYPDDVLGHVPAALVVLAPPAEPEGPAAVARVVATANGRLPGPLRVRFAVGVDEIPGSAYGKVRRRELSRRLLTDPALRPTTTVPPTEGDTRDHPHQQGHRDRRPGGVPAGPR